MPVLKDEIRSAPDDAATGIEPHQAHHHLAQARYATRQVVQLGPALAVVVQQRLCPVQMALPVAEAAVTHLEEGKGRDADKGEWVRRLERVLEAHERVQAVPRQALRLPHRRMAVDAGLHKVAQPRDEPQRLDGQVVVAAQGVAVQRDDLLAQRRQRLDEAVLVGLGPANRRGVVAGARGRPVWWRPRVRGAVWGCLA